MYVDVYICMYVDVCVCGCVCMWMCMYVYVDAYSMMVSSEQPVKDYQNLHPVQTLSKHLYQTVQVML